MRTHPTRTPTLTSCRELDVWKQKLLLIAEVYRVTRQLPAEERFGITAQIRRAAVSISCNIAEGYGRTTTGEYLNHLSMARGSTNEIEALGEVCVTLTFLADSDVRTMNQHIVRVRQMLGRLRESLKKKRVRHTNRNTT